ncbi:hypothetical protein L4D77_25540 [Photobacterium frigidiphilum]|uniref:Uncharacterized protein n=1 Tax=Photobacterium frigidiphilum TaxID=264736 RepID=A0A2T3JBV7_9GAMM|nr:hypothetical protein [Photobacterium frigidiphilum]PSU46332.1 hypothetical protein C9J12_18810 [Photobacterium frigidiphilum]
MFSRTNASLFIKYAPLLGLLAVSSAHADNLVERLNQVDNSLQKAHHSVQKTKNSINNSQNKFDNTQRSIQEAKEGTYVEKRTERSVKNTKRKAVDNLINRSNRAIRDITNT